jgi:hypothetical protein
LTSAFSQKRSAQCRARGGDFDSGGGFGLK